jgi:hypothetical protein
MRFLTREVLGWALLLLGLYVFYKAYGMLREDPVHHYVGGSGMIVVGIIIFRGGIHLLKVAVAAQVCLRAAEAAEAGQPAPAARPPSRAVPRPAPSGRQVHGPPSRPLR